ncbi:hypothetical protein [Bacterioplanoides sp.]|uniref:hypothetical protein n=1 Tax=Bacterioplanoides sp. TaxID=2066072 RepID=UPI003B58F343
MNNFRHIRCAILITLMLALTTFNSHAGGVMLVSASQELNQSLSREQVRNLYMGASLGYGLKPLALPPRNRLRSRFNTQVIGLPESRIQSYWAQMKFTGRMKPPKEIRDEQTLIQQLLENPDCIGYLPADTPLPDALKVVFRSE